MRHRIKKEPYPDSKHTLCRSGTEVGYYEYIIKWLTQERRNADIGFGGKSAGWWNHVLGVAQTGKQGKVVHTLLFCFNFPAVNFGKMLVGEGLHTALSSGRWCGAKWSRRGRVVAGEGVS